MVLPRFLLPTNNTTSLSLASASSISLSNNQNSIWLALKDTLHLVNKIPQQMKFFFYLIKKLFKFLIGIMNLNYEYDGYLQRVVKNIITNYTMKYQLVS